ncbi:MAG: PucR family transcriptional regulator, partial [Chloroflexi bacterium]
IPFLLMVQNPALAERFVRETLGVLLDPATRNREQLMETLETHLSRGSVKDSAAELKLHRHTVLYRLDRLRQLLGRNLDEPATRLRLQLAIGLRKLL